MARVDSARERAISGFSGNVRAPHLDALRILASAGIVVLHYSNYVKEVPVGRFVYEHTWHFNLFVDLFFVISGFVIASQYLDRVSDRRAIGRFLWRRLARIYPLHILTFMFYVAIGVLLYLGYVHVENVDHYPLSDIPAQVLLLHAIDGQRLAFNFPSWSLSAEMVCYLLFPLIAFAGLRSPATVLVSALTVAAVLTIYCVISDAPLWPHWINKGGALRAVPGFLLGVALHLFRGRVARLPIGWLLLPSFSAFIVFGWALPALAALALVCLIAIAAVHCDETAARTGLSRLGLGRWAHLTYSSYMLHMPVATVVVTAAGRFLVPHWLAGQLVLVIGAMVVLVFASMASYRLFENPVRRRLQGAWERQPAALTAGKQAA
jgi:peptidoglycan/LPS O-acetylase OafA/YrhL